MNDPAGTTDHSTDQLLLRMLQEMRGIRRILERQDTPADGAHKAFLAAVSQLVGDSEWTCDELMCDLEQGDSLEVARLQAVLREHGIGEARALGVFLRGRVGLTGGGLRLQRHRATRSGVRRWSVTTI